jgi:microcystin-dependent protein
MDPFVAEIRIFPGNFAPLGWALCNGQLMPISQNTALFSLLGTTYGGDGKATFALPDLRGRAPMHPGQGPGLSPRVLGESAGSEAESIQIAQMPAHAHPQPVSSQAATTGTPGPGVTLAMASTNTYRDPGTLVLTGATAGGAGEPHENMQPFLVMNFIIALQGIFPPRE